MHRLRARTALAAITCAALAGACSSFTSADDPSNPDGGAADVDAQTSDAQGDDGPAVDAPGDGAPPPAVVLASGFSALRGITADDATVYFTEQTPGFMHTVPLAGGSPAMFGLAGSPLGLARLGQTVFWCDHTDRAIHSWMPGPTVQSTGSLSPAPFAIAATTSALVTLAFDYPRDSNVGYLQLRADPVAHPEIATNTLVNLSNPFDVAAAGNVVTWTESASGAVNQIVLPDTSTVIHVASGETDCELVAADSHGVYWTLATAGEVRVRETTSPMATSLAKDEKTPVALASDESGVYWIRSDGKLRRWRRVDGKIETLADGFVAVSDINARSLALTSSYVVWLTEDGTVLRHAK